MNIQFESGSQERAKGHALIYFQDSSEPGAVWATYLVVLPITVDVSKYVPPFLMNQMGELGAKNLSAFAFPPAPEKLSSREELEKLASARDDDILFGGSVNSSDVTATMMAVNEAIQQYGELCDRGDATFHVDATEDDEDEPGAGINEVLYGLMSEGDRLNELTKLVGRLRFAVDGVEESLIKETEDEIGVLAEHLPQSHNIEQLVQAVKFSDPRGAKLADLYLKRCYHLTHEAYGELGRVEEEIRILEAEEPSA